MDEVISSKLNTTKSNHINRTVSYATMHQTPLTVDSDEHIRYDQKG